MDWIKSLINMLRFASSYFVFDEYTKFILCLAVLQINKGHSRENLPRTVRFCQFKLALHQS